MTFLRSTKDQSAALAPRPARLRRTWIILGAVLHFSAVPVLLGEIKLPATASSQLEPKLKGLVLIEELNCVACHAGANPSAAKTAPRLSAVGSRVNPKYLEAFIADPQGTKPGTTMPDLL